MSVQIKQPTSDQLVVTQGRERAAMLLGLFIALPGVYLYYYLGWGLYENGLALIRGDTSVPGQLLGSLPGLVITLLVGACFLVPGLFMFATKTMVLDRHAQTITQLQQVGPYRRQKVYPMPAFTVAEIDFATPKEKQRKIELFDIQLCKAEGTGLHIATVTAHEVQTGIDLTRQLATFLRYEYRNQIDHWVTGALPTESHKPSSV